VRAEQIKDLLAIRHSEDIFVTECKTGSTYFDEYLKFDAWTAKKSWLNPLYTGYEVKVSRSDFTHDEKYRGYLKYCNQFYWVCPADLIKPEEVSADCGLLWVAKTGTRLYMKKKAPYRQIEYPQTVIEYILMSRSMVTKNEFVHYNKSIEYWKEYLKKLKENKELGYEISKGLQERFNREVELVRRENESLKRKMENYEQVKTVLAKLGYDPQYIMTEWRMEDNLKQALFGLPADFENNLEQAISGLQHIRQHVTRV
jgi:hypothetical protein